MNEWSPSGNYSSPGTLYQAGRSFRSQWDDSEKGTKLLAVNLRAMAESRNRSYQQHSLENISKTSLSACSKLGAGNGTSDPRFKRVIPPGVQNDACVGTEAKIPKASIVSDGREAPMSKLSVRNAPESKTKKSWVENINNPDDSKVQDSIEQSCEKLNAAEDNNIDQSQDHLKAVDVLSFNHDIVVKSESKESLSDCTLNSRNSFLVSEDFGEELTDASEKVLLSTRVKKVQNWMHDQIPKPEKKHSVITVIGQIQDPENESSAFQEIDIRRKLVKELDKYAVCKKIIDTDKKKDPSDTSVKMNPSNNNKGIVVSGSNETLKTSSYISAKVSRNKSNKHTDVPNKEKRSNVAVNDSAVPLCEEKEHFSVKKKIMKCQSKFFFPFRGLTFSCLSYQKIFCFMIITTGILCWFAFSSIQNGTLVAFDIFNAKPKPITWYERLCHWLWELFRPASNYQRTKPWRSF